MVKNIEEIKDFIYILKRFEKNCEAIDECDHFLELLECTPQSVASFKALLVKDINFFSDKTDFEEARKVIQKQIFLNCFI